MNGTSGSLISSTKDKLSLGSVLLVALLGSLAIFYATRWGPWAFSDSTEYIVSARNLLAGHGLGLFGPTGAFHPLILHPPLYSLVLSLLGLLGMDLVSAARWLDVLLFGSTILVVGVSLYYVTRSWWLSITASLLLLSIPAWVDVSSGAMSESLFIFTGLAGVCLVLLFLQDHRTLLLVLAALLSGFSMLTRYAGLAFILAGMVALLFYTRKAWKNRLSSTVLFALVSTLPTIGWLVWLSLKSPAARVQLDNPNALEQLTQFRLSFMEILWSWLPYTSLLPAYSYNLARNISLGFVFLLLVLFGLAVWKMRRQGLQVFDSRNGIYFALSMLALLVASLLILGFSYIYTLPTPDLISRTFLPVQISLLLAFFSLLLFFTRLWPSAKWLNLVPILLAASLSISYLHDSLYLVSQFHQSGFGYTSRDWQASKIIPIIEQLPADTPLVTNESALVLFYTNRPAYDITELVNSLPLSTTARYGDDLADPPQKAFQENGAALILFSSSYWQFQRIYGDQASARLENLTQGLSIFYQSGEGAIYFFSPSR